ncbi:MAG: guanylate kinase [Lentisphaeria bacterium]|nr:guanylate kinase [Lentisphaeria bacterium]
MNNGLAIILSGPSGAGKSTLVKKVNQWIPGMLFSISCTTRAPRPGETDGVDYHFISQEEFEKGIANGDFLEHANVHGNYYGTPKAPIMDAICNDKTMILDIDIQGARQIRASLETSPLSQSIEYIFVAPPSLEVLETRLRKRGTETEEVIQKRLKNARTEVQAWQEYQFLVLNDDVEIAARKLESIIRAALCKTHRTIWNP